MSAAIEQSLMQEVGSVIRDRLGLHYPAERSRDLEAALSLVAGAFDCADAEQCARRIVSRSLDGDDLDTLAQALTVGETNFFRDPEVFRALERTVLPPLIEERRDRERRLRIWSAGCCTGEEAYTIAMILQRVLPDIESWNVTLLATDLNPHFLRRARVGVYGKWSFRRVSAWSLRRHFEPTADGRHQIADGLRRMVTFDHLNLAEGGYPSVFNNTNAMDVVLCRNVLIYFDQPTVERVVTQLRSCLLPGGWLALGRSERAPDTVDRLRPETLDGDVWYRRDDVATEPSPRSATATAHAAASARRAAFPETIEHRFEAGDYAAVASELEAFLAESQPTRGDRRRAIRLLAQARANLGELDEAQRWCEQALDEDGLDPRLHYLLASVLLERDRLDEAEASFRRALVVDDRYVLAHFALGNLMRRRRDPEAAREHFGHTLALLRHHRSEEIIPDSEGLTAGRLSEIAEQAMSHC